MVVGPVQRILLPRMKLEEEEEETCKLARLVMIVMLN